MPAASVSIRNLSERMTKPRRLFSLAVLEVKTHAAVDVGMLEKRVAFEQPAEFPSSLLVRITTIDVLRRLALGRLPIGDDVVDDVFGVFRTDRSVKLQPIERMEFCDVLPDFTDRLFECRQSSASLPQVRTHVPHLLANGSKAFIIRLRGKHLQLAGDNHRDSVSLSGSALRNSSRSCLRYFLNPYKRRLNACTIAIRSSTISR